MNILISPESHNQFYEYLDVYYQKRHEVFNQRLDWKLSNQNGREKDEYDTLDAYYILVKDDKYGICGGIRLIPSTKNYMLKCTFSHLVKNKKNIPCSQEVWETSRLLIDFPRNKESKENIFHNKTIELIQSIVELGISLRIKKIITVTDTKVERIYRHAKWPVHRISDVKKIGNTFALAGTLEISKKKLNEIRKKSGIYHSTLWMPALEKNSY